MGERLSYKVSTTIAGKYAPIINRSRMLHEQTQKSEFPRLRESGATNIDVWIDGSIYPHHPTLRKRPSFRSVSELLEFVGEGKSGLLGYVESLSACDDSTVKFRLAEAEREVNNLLANVRILNDSIEERNRLLQFTRDELRTRLLVEEANRETLAESELLKSEVQSLREECRHLNALSEERFHRMNALSRENEENSLETEINYWIEIESLRENYDERIKSIQFDLKRTTATLRRREQRLQNLTRTPQGYSSTVHMKNDLSSLVSTGGQAKRRLRLLRSVISPATTNHVQTINQETGSRKRLRGDRTVQTQTGKVLASLLSQIEVKSMCESSKMSDVGISMANFYLDKIGESVGANEICETMDRNGITQAGYAAVYKQFKGATRAAGRGLRVGCLPNPHQVSVARSMLNLKLSEYVGNYYPIVNTLEISPPSKSKTKDLVKVSLNEFNSIFVDVEQVQRTMVELYGITPSELNGKPLIFVLKLDEAEIIHAQKMERVSITLMNRALDTSIGLDSEQYFSVQSEREIWPIASFQVPRESHEILKWVFDQTQIPTLIKLQDGGQLLKVPGIGDFSVEWHLAADLKTIKCVYGLKHGANSLHSCIYCCQERMKSRIGSVVDAEATSRNRCKYSWNEGLFSRKITAKPLTGEATKERWQPIFGIPLDRVHICTLHGLNRIIEKMVHLHFIHIWTIRDNVLRKSAVGEMEKTVSSTGAHGGNVTIFKDEDLSGKSNNIPNKPSFSGAHALKFFKLNPSIQRNPPRKLYVDIVNAEKNTLNRGQAKRNRLELWQALDALRPYFTGLRLTHEQSAEDFKLKVEAWGQLYLKCFGEHQVTHYMHIFIRHAPYFVEKYGSLAVWSCQGMENSHHAAKSAYQRHTQHAGGRNKKSPLIQTFQHWYRIIAHRFRNKDATINTTQFDSLQGEEAIAARREASLTSSASLHSALWRAKCTRVGSRWVPNEDPIEASL